MRAARNLGRFKVQYYEYDQAGYLEWMYGARTYVADASYKPHGEVEQLALGANYRRGIWQTFDYYEGTRRLSSMSLDREGEDPSDVDLAYTYDPAGNPVKIADTGAQAGLGDVQCFTYDHHRRLVDAWSQNDTQCGPDAASATIGGPAPYGHTYSYDDAGNRVSLEDHVTAVTTTYSYPAAGQAGPHTLSSLSTSDGVTVDYTYDDAGNTLSADSSVTGEDQVYQWNSHGRIGTAATETGTSEFVYGADGSRLLRRTPDATTLYVHGDEITVDHSTGEVSGQRYYTFGGQTLAIRDSGSDELHTLAADLWGTPTVAVDNYSSGITTRRFDPFGSPRHAQPVTGWPGDRGWHTGTHDEATGLIHMGARQYNPTTGRFLSVDPLMDPFDPDQVHGYAYANNNPLAFNDPSGLKVCTGCLPGVGSLAGGPFEPDLLMIRAYSGALVDGVPLRDLVSGTTTGKYERSDPASLDEMSMVYHDEPYAEVDWTQKNDLLVSTWCYNNPDACYEAGTIGWDDVAEAASATYNWAKDNRGTLTTVGATAGCIVPAVGWGTCAGMQAGALAVRTEQDVHDGTATTESVVGDTLLTATTTAALRVPMALMKFTSKAPVVRRTTTKTDFWEGLEGWQRAMIGAVAASPAASVHAGCYATGHDREIC